MRKEHSSCAARAGADPHRTIAWPPGRRASMRSTSWG